MPKENILIVEDDEDIVEMITYNLKKEGFRTSSVMNGEDAVARIVNDQPDIILLDLMLPRMDGLEVCRTIRNRKETAHIPVIMLTAKSQEVDKILGLELGADDYVTKPFSPRELIARIRAVLRRVKPVVPEKIIKAGPLVIDLLKHKVSVSGEAVELTATEFKMLEYLARSPGDAFSRENILNYVFDYKSDIYDRTIDTHIKTLRKKLGTARNYVETIRGIGYRFREL
jgi:phosphate regulon transcriptional regulator PhoB